MEERSNWLKETKGTAGPGADLVHAAEAHPDLGAGLAPGAVNLTPGHEAEAEATAVIGVTTATGVIEANLVLQAGLPHQMQSKPDLWVGQSPLHQKVVHHPDPLLLTTRDLDQDLLTVENELWFFFFFF